MSITGQSVFITSDKQICNKLQNNYNAAYKSINVFSESLVSQNVRYVNSLIKSNCRCS